MTSVQWKTLNSELNWHWTELWMGLRFSSVQFILLWMKFKFSSVQSWKIRFIVDTGVNIVKLNNYFIGTALFRPKKTKDQKAWKNYAGFFLAYLHLHQLLLYHTSRKLYKRCSMCMLLQAVRYGASNCQKRNYNFSFWTITCSIMYDFFNFLPLFFYFFTNAFCLSNAHVYCAQYKYILPFEGGSEWPLGDRSERNGA